MYNMSFSATASLADHEGLVFLLIRIVSLFSIQDLFPRSQIMCRGLMAKFAQLVSENLTSDY